MAKTTTTHKKYKGVIVSKTDIRNIRKVLDYEMKTVIDTIVYRFSEIGEECVKIARELGDYQDITGNLRSSIGYCILVDGKTIVNGQSKQYKNGAKGVSESKALLNTLKAKFPWGVVLIVCAGMEYAAYVEDIRHKDVLTSAEHRAESLINDLIERLNNRK